LDLFGQRIPTATQFAGPVRLRLQLTPITMSRWLADFTGSGGDPAGELQQALVRGFEHFFVWRVVVVGAVSLAVLRGGGLAVRSFHDASVRVLETFDLLRRVTGTATAPLAARPMT
jgi:hypothetical protein